MTSQNRVNHSFPISVCIIYVQMKLCIIPFNSKEEICTELLNYTFSFSFLNHCFQLNPDESDQHFNPLLA